MNSSLVARSLLLSIVVILNALFASAYSDTAGTIQTTAAKNSFLDRICVVLNDYSPSNTAYLLAFMGLVIKIVTNALYTLIGVLEFLFVLLVFVLIFRVLLLYITLPDAVVNNPAAILISDMYMLACNYIRSLFSSESYDIETIPLTYDSKSDTDIEE
ncbi:hypothetical protein NEOKW01_1098 [Nematocida sp. AWRm80]|nr:hypothetical protein NEOKW01_1098 [Nematocida sp. AWRm80]